MIRHRFYLALAVVLTLPGWAAATAAAQNEPGAWRLEHVAGIKPERLRQPTGALADDGACRRRYAEVFTAEVIEAIRGQRFDDLFVSGDGAMIGNGEVWFAAVSGSFQ